MKIHLNSSLYRYEYGIQIGNSILEDVIREYPNIFELTRLASRYLEQMVGLPISDEEVAYLALHFGAHLKIVEKKTYALRILLVCVNGVSTGNMLKREIYKLLPFAEIVGVTAAVDAINVQNICDLVISTVKIKCVVPVLIVHPILTDLDRRTILNHQLIYGKQKIYESSAVFRIVKKYLNKKDYDAVKADLDLYFSGEQGEKEEQSEKDGLLYFLNHKTVQIIKERVSWQEAIRISGECLVESGAIENRFLDNVISHTCYYGPYMFVTDDVVIAHARPEEGVNRLAVSLAIFKTPVQFANSQSAKLIFVLAAEDQEKHLKILRDIMKITDVFSRIEELENKDTIESALAYLDEIVNDN